MSGVATSPSSGERVAIVGGGISGLATAYELTRNGVDFTLFESSGRLGGTVESLRTGDFLVIERGPDSWVTEKPWARELAVELGLEEQIVLSNDQWRRTYLLEGRDGFPRLVPIPDGMRLMVPAKWGSVLESPLLSWQARLAYLREPKRAAELKETAPQQDESVADFVRRHFGNEVTRTLAGPLLAAIFGGDVEALSVRATMPAFVKMEAEHGSLIQAVQRLEPASRQAIFSSLAGGLKTLVDRLISRLPLQSFLLHQPVLRIQPGRPGWRLSTAGGEHHFHSVVLATPAHVTRELLTTMSDGGDRIAGLLPDHASSAIIVGLAFSSKQAAGMRIPRGFGFVVPPGGGQPLLACTFVHQKFSHCAPAGAALLRAFFGGPSGEALLGESDDSIIERARRELSRILGPLPEATEVLVRRWPRSLPQYAVGHLERVAELQSRVSALGGLHLVGNAYYGVGLPDLIREGRATARLLAGSEKTCP